MSLFLLRFLSYWPLWALYGLSSVAASIASRVYRKRLVEANIKKVFPDKSVSERRHIADRFYRNLTDLAVEVIKLSRMNPEDLKKRIRFVENEAYREVQGMDSPILFYTTHVSNWEWLNAFCQITDFIQTVPIYKPLKNKKMDGYVKSMRENFGGTPVAMSEMLKTIRHMEGRSGLGILADQSPRKTATGKIWANFFGMETAFFKGVVALPQLTKWPAYFASIHRVRRGKYVVEFTKIGDPPYERRDFSVFAEYIRLSEALIEEHPDEWLWSHNRWKYQRADNEEIIKFS